jgi:hypothetical protein
MRNMTNHDTLALLPRTIAISWLFLYFLDPRKIKRNRHKKEERASKLNVETCAEKWRKYLC